MDGGGDKAWIRAEADIVAAGQSSCAEGGTGPSEERIMSGSYAVGWSIVVI